MVDGISILGIQENQSAMLTLSRTTSGSWILKATCFVSQPLSVVFPFFSDAQNLNILTPPWLNFQILTPMPILMQEGALIDYRLRIRGIPVRWQSRIAVWEPPHRFVDEQLRGPYRQWIHEHRFEEKDGGVLMSDRVEYSVYGGWLIHRIFVQQDVLRIFNYRLKTLTSLFATSSMPAGDDTASGLERE